MKTTFADVEPNPAIVCVVGPAAVVTFSFNSRQAAVGGAVLALEPPVPATIQTQTLASSFRNELA